MGLFKNVNVKYLVACSLLLVIVLDICMLAHSQPAQRLALVGNMCFVAGFGVGYALWWMEQLNHQATIRNLLPRSTFTYRPYAAYYTMTIACEYEDTRSCYSAWCLQDPGYDGVGKTEKEAIADLLMKKSALESARATAAKSKVG